VKLLTDETLRTAIRATDLPEITRAQREDLESLPVSIYKSREDLWEYFGFRHVNGPKEWDSLSKAAYIARVRRDYDVPLSEIARKIGDQNSTVERIYRGFVLLEQAENMTRFKREDRVRNRFSFSHLYTAASYDEVRQFLGVSAEDSLDSNPVQRRNLQNLEELMTWLFGSKELDREPVVQTQAPDLGRLRQVIGNKQALSALRSGISLPRAFAISQGDSRRFEEALAQAKDAIQEAKGTVTTGYKGSRELLDQMRSICTLADSVLDEMDAIASKGSHRR
jgi:hypothetical protein